MTKTVTCSLCQNDTTEWTLGSRGALCPRCEADEMIKEALEIGQLTAEIVRTEGRYRIVSPKGVTLSDMVIVAPPYKGAYKDNRTPVRFLLQGHLFWGTWYTDRRYLRAKLTKNQPLIARQSLPDVNTPHDRRMVLLNQVHLVGAMKAPAYQTDDPWQPAFLWLTIHQSATWEDRRKYFRARLWQMQGMRRPMFGTWSTEPTELHRVSLYSEGWTQALVNRVVDTWRYWLDHNGRQYCPHLQAQAALGFNIERERRCEICGWQYHSSIRYYEPLSAELWQFIESLPNPFPPGMCKGEQH